MKREEGQQRKIKWENERPETWSKIVLWPMQYRSLYLVRNAIDQIQFQSLTKYVRTSGRTHVCQLKRSQEKSRKCTVNVMLVNFSNSYRGI